MCRGAECYECVHHRRSWPRLPGGVASGASLTQTQGGFLNPGGSWSVPLSIKLSPPTSTQRGLHLTLTESSRDSCSYLMDSPGVHSQLVAHRCWLQKQREGCHVQTQNYCGGTFVYHRVLCKYPLNNQYFSSMSGLDISTMYLMSGSEEHYGEK